MADCSAVLERDAQNVKALFRRGQARVALKVMLRFSLPLFLISLTAQVEHLLCIEDNTSRSYPIYKPKITLVHIVCLFARAKP